MRRLALPIAALASLLGLSAGAQAQLSPSAFTSATRYDASRRVTGTIAADPDDAGPLHYAAVRNSYDPAGRLFRVETGELAEWQPESRDPSAWTTFTIFQRVDTVYDAMDRKTVETMSSVAAGAATAEAVTQYSYDGSGRPDCTAVRMNRAAFASLPASACTPGAAGPDGPDRIARNVYDGAGQLLQVRKAVGTAIEQAYATYSYTPNGQRQDVVDANGGHAQLAYDGFDRPAQWRFPAPAAVVGYAPTTPANALATAGAVNSADYEEYGYDPNANRTSLRKRDGTSLAYGYDALDRMTQKTVPASASGAAGYAIFYGYDNRGLELYARFGSAAGPGVTNAYDGFGALASSATSMDGTARTLTSVHDLDGNRTSLTGDAGAWGYSSASSYDGLDRVSGLIESGHPIAQLGYDPAGRRSSLALGFDAFTSSAAYGYDGVGRLGSLTHDLAGAASDQALTFAYNPASQMVTWTSSNAIYASNSALAVERVYAVNGLNQYTGTTSGGTPSATFGYDANGNLISDGANSYVYDAENRLVSASGGHIATLAYDPVGRLWQVTAPTGTTRFVYDGARLAIEYDGAGTVLRAYAHGTGPDEPLVWYEAVSGGTSRRYLHADHQGSIVAVADQNGNAFAVNAYDEWGIPNAGNKGRFGYTGQAWLGELGLWYYKARLYSPTLGRFLQTDPTGYDAGINFYSYVENDPRNKNDSEGNKSYFVARLLDHWAMKALGFGHSFVVTNARYVGDPKGQVHSFGELANKKMGNVSDPRRASAFSSPTAASDRQRWLALKPGSRNAVPIPAKDETVAAAAAAVRENNDYKMVPGFYSSAANSNSAAIAVAERAIQTDSNNPKAVLDTSSIIMGLPGINEENRVQFNDDALKGVEPK